MEQKNIDRFMSVQSPGFKDPAIKAKADETRKKNAVLKKARKEAVDKGFEASMLSDPDVQKELLNKLTAMALNGDGQDSKWAMKTLIEHGAFKMPAMKVEQEENKKEETMTAEDAVNILKNAGI